MEAKRKQTVEISKFSTEEGRLDEYIGHIGGKRNRGAVAVYIPEWITE